LLHRAMVDCKMSNTTGEEDNNNTISKSYSYSYSERENDDNNNRDRDCAAESRYADLKDLKAERRLIPCVFIASSPRPILAVYYLRYGI
jgi:hypothetical protein